MPEPHLSYKPRGLIKKVIALVRFMKPPPDFARQQTITVKIDGSDYHLISYYTQEDLATGLLRRPTSRSDLMAIDIPPELTRSTNFRYPPNLEEAHDMGTGSSHRCVLRADPNLDDLPLTLVTLWCWSEVTEMR